jgi:predicted nucleotidyltransferase
MGIKERWKDTRKILLRSTQATGLLLPVIKKDSRIIACYLFGSRASKRETPDSDIDIAIYTSRDFTWDNYYLLYGELSRKLKSDRLDLIWLNQAEPIICFEVLKSGKLIFFRDVDEVNELELKIRKRYYDYILYLMKHRRFKNDL